MSDASNQDQAETPSIKFERLRASLEDANTAMKIAGEVLKRVFDLKRTLQYKRDQIAVEFKTFCKDVFKSTGGGDTTKMYECPPVAKRMGKSGSYEDELELEF